MEKSLILTIEEAKEEYINKINEVSTKYNLPMYFIEIIFKEIYNEIKALKNQEIEKEKEIHKEKNNEKKEENAKK